MVVVFDVVGEEVEEGGLVARLRHRHQRPQALDGTGHALAFCASGLAGAWTWDVS